MRVLVTGDRNWTDKNLIRVQLLQVLSNAVGPITVINGDARGADRLSTGIAIELGYSVKRFPADWNTYRRAAGPIRNQQMLDEGKPDLVLAFHDDLAASKGTADMVRRAEKAGVEVILVSH